MSEGNGTRRPYRLYDATRNVMLQWRYFSDSRRAHMAALIECGRWAKIGTSITVVNNDTGRSLGTYTRRVHHVSFE